MMVFTRSNRLEWTCQCHFLFYCVSRRFSAVVEEGEELRWATASYQRMVARVKRF